MTDPGAAPTEAQADARPLWGIAQYDDGARRVPWPVSHGEIERAMGGAVSTLGRLGVGQGSRVLWCTVLSEAAHFWPLFIATMLGGGQFSLADATQADARRVAMFLRRLPYHAIMGVNEAVLDGLDDLGRPYTEVFGEVAMIGARPGAYERLVEVGLTPHWFVLCGPTVAIAAEPGGPALVDAGEWGLDEEDGRILVTSRRPRATTFTRTSTAIRGRLVDESSFVPQMGECS
jgi:hypothetical protein